MNKKECVLILGMHRSGTSFVGRFFDLLGYYGGDNLKKASFDNPLGFFENEGVVSINDELLSKSGFSWDNYYLIETFDSKKEEYSNLVDKAKKILNQLQAKNKSIYIKDPRLCITIRFWMPILEDLGYNIRVLFSIRNPANISASLRERNFFSEQKAYWLTWVYWANAIINLENQKIFIQAYEDFVGIEDFDCTKLANFLSFKNEDVIHAINRAFEKRLAHSLPVANTQEHHPVFALYDGILSNNDLSGGGIIDHSLIMSRYNKNSSVIQSFITEKKKYVKFIIKKTLELENAHSPIFPWDVKGSKCVGLLDLSSLTGVKGVRAFVYTGQSGAIEIDHCWELNKEGHKNPMRLSSDSRRSASNLIEISENGIWLEIGVIDPSNIDSIEFSFSFHTSFSEPYRILQQADSVRLIDFKLLVAAIGSPVKILSELNLRNIQKFRRALRNESLSQVARNMVKYMNKKINRKVNAKTQSHTIRDFSKAKNAHGEYGDKPYSILFILSEWPNKDKSSGERRTLNILNLLSAIANIHIYSFERPDYAEVESLEIEGYFLHFEIKSLKKLERNHFQFMIISYYYNLENVPAIVSYFRSASIIIDTVDINWPKEESAIDLGIPVFNRYKVLRNKTKEINAYKSADQVWVVTESDQEKLKAISIDTPISIVSNVHDVDLQDYNDVVEPRMLFIGGFSYYANRVSIIWIVNELLPKIKAQIPECKLIIAGSNIDGEIRKLANNDGVEIRGFVPESELLNLYQEVKLAFVPLMVGSGIKGKICEAISYGVPVVTNSIGNEGINLINGQNVLIGNDIESIVQSAVLALKNEFDLKNIALNAKEHLRKLVQPKEVKQRLFEALFPQISLCIITWNGLDLVKKCIESILENTVYPNYQILVHSNGCTDGSQEYLEKLALSEPKLIPILSKVNEVFVLPNNAMIFKAMPDDVVLLNNDIVVTPNWLCELHIAAYMNDKIGIVGSKLLYPDGSLQEYGSSMNELGNGINHGKGDLSPFRKEYSSVKATGYVSGCSFYIKRTTVDAIGVLDEDFHPIYCEDCDYCYTAWKNDLYTVVAGKSVLYHFEGATNGKDTSVGLKQYQVKNLDLFLQKHSSDIRAIERKIKKINSSLYLKS